MRRERKRLQIAVMDFSLVRKEHVVAAGVVPAVGCAAHDPDPAGHELVCLACTGESGMVIRADEYDGGTGTLGWVAWMSQAPAAQKRVIGKELLAVVRGAAGEIDLDEQVEGEL